jgi:ParB-like chromosome segregation protein Spo0J
LTTETRRISDIKVGQRFRKDLGDIKSLVKSIQEIGLLHPVVICQNDELIVGARRLEAYQRLGYTEIPIHRIDLINILKGEFHENAIRKGFTISERVAILEEIEKQRISHKPAKGCNLLPFQKENKGRKSVDIAAEYITNTSPRKLSLEKKIVEAARKEPEKWSNYLKKIDEGKTSVDYVHKMVIRAEDHYNTLRKGELPEERFDIILADLP